MRRQLKLTFICSRLFGLGHEIPLLLPKISIACPLAVTSVVQPDHFPPEGVSIVEKAPSSPSLPRCSTALHYSERAGWIETRGVVTRRGGGAEDAMDAWWLKLLSFPSVQLILGSRDSISSI